MKRRKFIQSSILASALTPSIINSACTDNSASKNKEKKVEQDIKAGSINQFEIEELQLQDFAIALQEKKITSVQLVEMYLSRIQQIDKTGPRLNSVIEINPDAIQIAKSLDDERNAGKIRSLLHGIPIMVKDNIETADKMMTTAGSLAMEGNIAKKDAHLITLLREAGAVILAKTNLSEWANFRSSSSCSGWSSRGGQTRNPYFTSQNPCGSSSGSGVAVSSNLCAAAIGTETDGSITCPASVNGIVGLKPTVGLVSRNGIIPISNTQDTAGPMGRTVSDVAFLLNYIVGIDANDRQTLLANDFIEKDYTSFLKVDALKKVRIGYDKTTLENPAMRKLFNAVKGNLLEQGAELVEIEYLNEINNLGEAEFELMKFEFKDSLNTYLKNANGKVKSLEELITYNKAYEDKMMPGFRQELLEQTNKMQDLNSPAYKSAYTKSHLGAKKIIDQIMTKNNLKAICGLTMGPACGIDMVYGDRWGSYFLTAPAAMSGYPHISVPAGTVLGLPVGLSFFGKAFQEGMLLGLAYAYEQAAKWRRKPEYKERYELLR